MKQPLLWSSKARQHRYAVVYAETGNKRQAKEASSGYWNYRVHRYFYDFMIPEMNLAITTGLFGSSMAQRELRGLSSIIGHDDMLDSISYGLSLINPQRLIISDLS